MSLRVGDIVEIVSPFYLQYAPATTCVVERQDIMVLGYETWLIGFPLLDKKLWILLEDVRVVGHVEDPE